MSDTPQPFTRRWKIAVVIALLIALANSGISTLREREDDRFQNHEARLDDLEDMVRGNDIGTAPRENSHHDRIEALEKRYDAIEQQLRDAKAN